MADARTPRGHSWNTDADDASMSAADTATGSANAAAAAANALLSALGDGSAEAQQHAQETGAFTGTSSGLPFTNGAKGFSQLAEAAETAAAASETAAAASETAAAVSETNAAASEAAALAAALATSGGNYEGRYADEATLLAATPADGDYLDVETGNRWRRASSAWAFVRNDVTAPASSLAAAAARYGHAGAGLIVQGPEAGVFEYAASWAAVQAANPWAAAVSEAEAEAAGLVADEAGGGKWAREWDGGPLNAAWAGLAPSASAATNTAALKAAVAVRAAHNGAIDVPDGTYALAADAAVTDIDTCVLVPDGVTLNLGKARLTTTADAALVRVGEKGSIRDGFVDISGAPSGAIGILLYAADTTAHHSEGRSVVAVDNTYVLGDFATPVGTGIKLFSDGYTPTSAIGVYFRTVRAYVAGCGIGLHYLADTSRGTSNTFLSSMDCDVRAWGCVEGFVQEGSGVAPTYVAQMKTRVDVQCNANTTRAVRIAGGIYNQIDATVWDPQVDKPVLIDATTSTYGNRVNLWNTGQDEVEYVGGSSAQSLNTVRCYQNPRAHVASTPVRAAVANCTASHDFSGIDDFLASATRTHSGFTVTSSGTSGGSINSPFELSPTSYAEFTITPGLAHGYIDIDLAAGVSGLREFAAATTGGYGIASGTIQVAYAADPATYYTVRTIEDEVLERFAFNFIPGQVLTGYGSAVDQNVRKLRINITRAANAAGELSTGTVRIARLTAYSGNRVGVAYLPTRNPTLSGILTGIAAGNAINVGEPSGTRNGNSAQSAYPLGVTTMHVDNLSFFPTAYGYLVTHKPESSWETTVQWFFPKVGLGSRPYWRRPSSASAWSSWVQVPEPSAASADTATAPGASYSQAEAQAVLTELRDLKTKMRTAGLLAT